MDVAYINPFLLATTDLFTKMIKQSLTLGKPSIRKPEDRNYKLYRLSTEMDLSGTVNGMIILSFSQPVVLALAGALIGHRLEAMGDEATDAIGEISNMIVGGARSQFPGAGKVQVSTPRVLATADVVYPQHLPIIVIPFDTAAGRFVIEVAISRTAKPSASGDAAPPAVAA